MAAELYESKFGRIPAAFILANHSPARRPSNRMANIGANMTVCGEPSQMAMTL